jgi:stage III sporulation protein AG
MAKKIYDLKNVKEKLSHKSIVIILVVVAFIGIFLIFLSEFINPNSKDNTAASSSSENSSSYVKNTEQRLEEIIGTINGVGRVKVMLTVESGVENIYETDNKNSNEKQQNAGQSSNVQENSSNESSHVIVDNSSGGQEALLKKQIQPCILGVVIVCDGGNNSEVKENVIHSVSTALGLPTNRISVNKMQPKN